MHKLNINALIATTMLLVMIGCSHGNIDVQGETLLDKNWGRSYETAKYNQIANPDAGKTIMPAEGFNGNAANNTVENYQQTFKERKDTEVTNILKLQ
jgi:hypothetical protein